MSKSCQIDALEHASALVFPFFRLDITDLYLAMDCYGVPITPEDNCAVADLDADGVVDEGDLRTGPFDVTVCSGARRASDPQQFMAQASV